MAKILSDKAVVGYRKLFPIVNDHIYLDHAGVAPISTRVKSKVNYFLDIALNKGLTGYDRLMEEVENVRTNFSRILNCKPEEIAFIKNTSHGLSLIAKGIEWGAGDNIIIFQKEFPANLYTWLDLKRFGVEVRQAPLINGRVEIKEIEKLIDNNTRLLSISSVQFTNGYRADLELIGNICKKNNILFCVDAIQSLGIVPINVNELNIDFLAADGHKWLLSPEGTGVLYCSNNVVQDISPVLLGWKSIVNDSEYEKVNLDLKPNALKFEEGSFNVLGIFALGASIELLLEIGIERIYKRIQYLGDLIIDEVNNREFILKTPISKNERAGIVSFSGNFNPSLLKDSLYKKNVIINVRDGAIRVAPHFYNTEDDIRSLFMYIDEIL